ncbi:MAG: nuclear transport factor 2 family protein [Bacteroidia bacterium]|nr:nuclear transport factor 2 family protein [Bacteroidia bacterium]
MDSNLHIARLWLAAFNEHNLEKLLALYAEDAIHYSPKLKRHPESNGQITGKDNLRAWWKEAFDRLPTLQYKATSLTASSERVFMEYTRQVEGEDNMSIAEVLDFDGDLIFASRVYHG